MQTSSVPRLASVVVVLLLSSASSIAQTSQDQKEREDADSLFRSIAGTIYKLAWPTATYKKAEFSGLQRVSNGIAVVMRLSGEGLFGDDLWLKLGVVVNKDGIQDIKVIDHDALFAGPFATAKALGELVAELNREYSKQHTQPTSAVGYSDISRTPGYLREDKRFTGTADEFAAVFPEMLGQAAADVGLDGRSFTKAAEIVVNTVKSCAQITSAIGLRVKGKGPRGLDGDDQLEGGKYMHCFAANSSTLLSNAGDARPFGLARHHHVDLPS